MTIRRTELIDQPLRAVGLLHDSLLVVLPDRAAQLVVVHLGLVLPLAPQFGHFHRVLDLEHAFLSVEPADHRHVGATRVHLLQQLLEEFPQVNWRRPMALDGRRCGGRVLAIAVGEWLLLLLLGWRRLVVVPVVVGAVHQLDARRFGLLRLVLMTQQR